MEVTNEISAFYQPFYINFHNCALFSRSRDNTNYTKENVDNANKVLNEMYKSEPEKLKPCRLWLQSDSRTHHSAYNAICDYYRNTGKYHRVFFEYHSDVFAAVMGINTRYVTVCVDNLNNENTPGQFYLKYVGDRNNDAEYYHSKHQDTYTVVRYKKFGRDERRDDRRDVRDERREEPRDNYRGNRSPRQEQPKRQTRDSSTQSSADDKFEVPAPPSQILSKKSFSEAVNNTPANQPDEVQKKKTKPTKPTKTIDTVIQETLDAMNLLNTSPAPPSLYSLHSLPPSAPTDDLPTYSKDEQWADAPQDKEQPE